MGFGIRKATIEDFGFLLELEESSFPDYKQSSPSSIKNGILSSFQEILIVEQGNTEVEIGAVVLYKYPKSLRIYSIAILPEYQNRGIGDILLKHVFEFANRYQFGKILIEVSSEDSKLIKWYEKRGFVKLGTLENYYGIGKDALKMEFTTNNTSSPKKTSNIIVINQPILWSFSGINASVISVKEYISNPIYQSNTDFRVFNLCSSYKYQSYGYYVSLLASARGQRVIPSATTIRDFRLLNVIHSATFDIDELINKSLRKENEKSFSLDIYFGQTATKGFKELAVKLDQIFEAPLFRVEFIKHEKWLIKKIQVLSLSKIPEDGLDQIYEFAKKYFDKKRFGNTKLINYKYDIAILVNPEEKTPPSCAKALQKFKNTANARGLYVEFITKADLDKINEFDALFIRETTNVNTYTYEFSRIAYAEGLVVIDDPWSILKCSNKIYQNEIFKKHKILTPKTTIFTKNMMDASSLEQMNYPLVLKQPDSAFSLGITKVENKEEAKSALENLFKASDMVVGQEFLYSEFDWRIGLIDNTPIFACKYYMSKGHWQIYNWKGEAEDNSGDSETLSIDLVPDQVLKTAQKAAALIGDGLYGVDLKMIDDKVFVVEVNDNPNIDAGIEDFVLKDKLYEIIIDSLFNRIEIAKNIQKINLRRQ